MYFLKVYHIFFIRTYKMHVNLAVITIILMLGLVFLQVTAKIIFAVLKFSLHCLQPPPESPKWELASLPTHPLISGSHAGDLWQDCSQAPTACTEHMTRQDIEDSSWINGWKDSSKLAPLDFFLRVVIKALRFAFTTAKITHHTMGSLGVHAGGGGIILFPCVGIMRGLFLPSIHSSHPQASPHLSHFHSCTWGAKRQRERSQADQDKLRREGRDQQQDKDTKRQHKQCPEKCADMVTSQRSVITVPPLMLPGIKSLIQKWAFKKSQTTCPSSTATEQSTNVVYTANIKRQSHSQFILASIPENSISHFSTPHKISNIRIFKESCFNFTHNSLNSYTDIFVVPSKFAHILTWLQWMHCEWNLVTLISSLL